MLQVRDAELRSRVEGGVNQVVNNSDCEIPTIGVASGVYEGNKQPCTHFSLQDHQQRESRPNWADTPLSAAAADSSNSVAEGDEQASSSEEEFFGFETTDPLFYTDEVSDSLVLKLNSIKN